MKITKIVPNLTTYRAVADRTDKDRYKCAWADFTLEFDFRRLSIHSDSGDYSYCWGHSDKDSLMNLLSRIDEYYLLNKLSNQDVLDIHESKLELIQYIKNQKEKYGVKKTAELIEEIDNMIDTCAEETYLRQVLVMVPGIDLEEIPVVRRHPSNARIICEFFMKYVQPIIKKEFEDSLIIRRISYTGDSEPMAIAEIENTLNTIEGVHVVHIKTDSATRACRNANGKTLSEDEFEKLEFEEDNAWFDDYDFIIRVAIETRLSEEDLEKEVSKQGICFEEYTPKTLK